MILLIILQTFFPLDGMYVKSDAELLASIITAECSICDEEEMYLVGSTVLNRVDDKDFPNTVWGVLSQPNQYIGRTSRWFITTPKTCKIACDLLEGRNRDFEVFYFYHPRASPNKDFVKNMAPYVKYKMEYHNYSTKIK